MATESELGIRQARALRAAVKRFPRSEFTIRRLLRIDESFRELCDELADAETALANVAENEAPLREVRELEWKELVQELVSEVEQTLRKFEAAP
jgi:hypothetical protein